MSEQLEFPMAGTDVFGVETPGACRACKQRELCPVVDCVWGPCQSFVPWGFCICCGQPATHKVRHRHWQSLDLPFCADCSGATFAPGGKIGGRSKVEKLWILRCPAHGDQEPQEVVNVEGPYPRRTKEGKTAWLLFYE